MAKGRRTQHKAKLYYESLGYAVEVVRRDKWRKDQDFFGLFDIIAIGSNDVVLSQIKTNGNVSKDWKLKLASFRRPNIGVRIEVCIYKDYSKGLVPSIINGY